MRVLIDECLPRRCSRIITDHEVVTVPAAGWAGKKNGELLALMESHAYDVFITADQNTQYQQNLKGRRIAIIVLTLPGLHFDYIVPLADKIHAALAVIQPGAFVVIRG